MSKRTIISKIFLGPINNIMFELFSHSFLINALIGGIGIALLCGPLGSFVLWQRMAYFGDALSHATLLGIALALLFEVNILFGVFAISIIIGSIITAYKLKSNIISSDAILGILSQSCLALGIILLYQNPSAELNILDYLFGNILAISYQDLILIYSALIVILFAIYYYWNNLIALTINLELAKAHQKSPRKTLFIFTLSLALTIGISLKLIGALLITSMLLIPAATARTFSKTPLQMALYASLIGFLNIIIGLGLSLYYDLPTGPAIILALSVSFIFVQIALKRA